MDPAKGQAAMDTWLRQQVKLSGVFDGKSAAAAADYVQKFRAVEGFPGGPVVGVEDYDPVWAENTLSYNGSNKVSALMGQGATAKEALMRAAPSLLAASQRVSLDGGRRVVDRSALANPDSNGWRRVPDGNPCSFCAMLVSRGNAYRSPASAGLGRHWHKRCGCSVEEVFGDWTPTEREQQYVDSYTSATTDLRAEGRQPTQTNVLEHMRLNGKFNDSPKPSVAIEGAKQPLDRASRIVEAAKRTPETGGDLATFVKTADRNELTETFGRSLNFTDPVTGLRAEINESSAWKGDEDGVVWHGKIFDSDGNKVGSFDRALSIDREGSLIVHHDLFKLNRQVRGGGFASRWNQHAEDWYSSQGVHRIELNANIDVGGYAWARSGYDWRDIKGAKSTMNRVMKEAPVGSPDRKAALAMKSRFDKAVSADDLPTPYELSRVGYSEGLDMWPGKAGMLGSDWDGKKVLR